MLTKRDKQENTTKLQCLGMHIWAIKFKKHTDAITIEVRTQLYSKGEGWAVIGKGHMEGFWRDWQRFISRPGW